MLLPLICHRKIILSKLLSYLLKQKSYTMAAEEVLELFDSYWFETTILFRKPPSMATEEPSLLSQSQSKLLLGPQLLRTKTLQVRSMSEQSVGCNINFSSNSLSPNSVLILPKRKTILSGKLTKEFSLEDMRNQEEGEVDMPIEKQVRSVRRKRSSKSLSELEFQEVKGFMDLGFVFSEEERDPNLVSLIPGLQRFGRKMEEGEVWKSTSDETVIPRPYLSEVWSALDPRKTKNPLLSWRMPALINEIDMKDHLRHWAHKVASSVKW